MQKNRPNKCITTKFLAAGAVLSLNPVITKKKLIQCSAERSKHFAPNINSYSVTNKQTNRETITINRTRPWNNARAKLLKRCFSYLLLGRLAGKRGYFSSNPAFRWRRVHSGGKSQAHFTDGTGVHFPAPRPFYSLAAGVIERRVFLSLVVELSLGV